MITPEFEVSQNETHVMIKVHVKYAKPSESTDFHIEGNTFILYKKPYHLRLAFSHPLQPVTESHTSHFDPSTCLLLCRLAKLNAGEQFDNLDD